MSKKPTYNELEQRIQELEKTVNRQKGVSDILSDGENQYQELIQKIQAAVVIHNAETKIVFANSKAKELLGFTGE